MSNFAVHGINDAGKSGAAGKAFGMCLGCVALGGAFFLARIAAHNLYCLGRVRLFFGRIFYVLNLRGRVAGGLRYWRGNVIAGGVCKQGLAGVNVEQRGGADSGGVGQAAALLRLAVGLATDAESGGGLGRAAVESRKGGKDSGHGVPRVRRARRLVIAAPSWERYALPTYSRQRVVDGLGVLRTQNNHAGAV